MKEPNQSQSQYKAVYKLLLLLILESRRGSGIKTEGAVWKMIPQRPTWYVFGHLFFVTVGNWWYCRKWDLVEES